LRPVLPVACKQDQATHQRVLEALPINLAKSGAFNIDDEGSVLGHEYIQRVCYIFYSYIAIFDGA
jgi:hypothetical protein